MIDNILICYYWLLVWVSLVFSKIFLVSLILINLLRLGLENLFWNLLKILNLFSLRRIVFFLENLFFYFKNLNARLLRINYFCKFLIFLSLLINFLICYHLFELLTCLNFLSKMNKFLKIIYRLIFYFLVCENNLILESLLIKFKLIVINI